MYVYVKYITIRVCMKGVLGMEIYCISILHCTCSDLALFDVEL